MTLESLLAKLRDREQIGKIMHESWSQTKREQGFHHPDEPCHWCDYGLDCGRTHDDLVPWGELAEAQKDINRHAFDAVIKWLTESA